MVSLYLLAYTEAYLSLENSPKLNSFTLSLIGWNYLCLF